MRQSPLVHVVAAALVDGSGAVLVQQRASSAHQGGLWEFPGGKLEGDESRWAGLVRELDEELGIQVLDGRPLIAIRHDYPDRSVLLDVWKLSRWHGEPRGVEGQPLKWVRPEALQHMALPAADAPVVRALGLPARYLITPEPDAVQDWMEALLRAIAADVPLIQLRATSLHPERYRRLASEVVQRARASSGTRVLLNADPELALELGAHGVHLNGRRATLLRDRPVPATMLVGVSCHDAADLEHAVRLDADFAVLGPVKPTATHPGAPILGWRRFGELLSQARIPTYALGGMVEQELERSWRSGAQGIAGIRGLWP